MCIRDRLYRKQLNRFVLGLFDSGLGGLTVLKRLHERLPQHDIVFFADQLHVP